MIFPVSFFKPVLVGILVFVYICLYYYCFFTGNTKRAFLWMRLLLCLKRSDAADFVFLLACFYEFSCCVH